MRYLMASNFTADATYNPDFSQIESDAAQIDVNTPYALYYPEKRPFFQEGADLFQTYVNAVYTRSINDPLTAAKLTGRINRTAIGYIGARDRTTPLVMPFEEHSVQLEVGKSFSNIVRVKQTLLDDSYIGALVTDRRLDAGGAGSDIGVDASLRFLTNYRFAVGLLGSRTAEPNDTMMTEGLNSATFERGRHTSAFDGESYWGHALHLALMRDARLWNSSITYDELSPTFRVDNGYLERNDRRQAEIWNGLYFRPNTKLIDEISPSMYVGRVWNFAGPRKDEWLMPQLNVLFKRQTMVEVSYLWSSETYRNVYLPGIERWTLNIESSPAKPVTVDLFLMHGRLIARNIEVPVLGRATSFSAAASLRFWRSLVISPEYAYEKLDYPDGTEIYSGYVTRTRINYQFSREWFLRLVVQYDNFNRSMSLEPLLSYKLNPFTIFYFGATRGFQQPEGRSGLLNNWTKTGHQYFLKLQYLLRT